MEATEVTVATPLVACAPHLMILLIEVGMTRVVAKECCIVAPETEKKQKAWKSREKENLGLIS